MSAHTVVPEALNRLARTSTEVLAEFGIWVEVKETLLNMSACGTAPMASAVNDLLDIA